LRCRQDWGIINSSAERTSEFIDYFSQKNSVTNYTKYEIFELIIASYNDTLLSELDSNELRIKFINFIKENAKEEIFIPILKYWKSIKNDEFPVGELL
jgi:hypothetical protein